MFAVVIGNIGMWIVEKLVTWNFEFLSVSYLMSELVFFFVYWMLQDYIYVNDVPPPVIVENKAPIIVVDSMSRAEKIQTIISALPENTTLSSRQMDILERILDGKSRKEIAADLYLSENTVKTHTGMLYRALGVSGRDEIYAMFNKQ
ncbi:MAG: helix-turn-helix transcriptional regulator [Clostridia bacterium]|nr:helix-turn-helix transcriptional regulator [Clostridia bacterium]